MKMQISINDEGAASVKLDGKEISGNITRLSMVIKPLCEPIILLSLCPDEISVTYGGDNAMNDDFVPMDSDGIRGSHLSNSIPSCQANL